MHRSSVEFFTKIHGFHSSGTKSWTHRGCWCSFACWNQQTLQVVRYGTLKIELNIPLSGLLLLRLPWTWEEYGCDSQSMWQSARTLNYHYVRNHTGLLSHFGQLGSSLIQVWTWNFLCFSCPSVHWVKRILWDLLKTIKLLSDMTSTWTHFVSFSWREKTQCGWQKSKRFASLCAVLP